MSLIPFILDLADELHEFNRCLATGMDVDDFGFGIYPHELQQQPQSPQQQQQQPQLSPQQLRRPRTAVSQLYWLPNTKQRHHPYYRSKACCGKSTAGAQAHHDAVAANAGAATEKEPNTDKGGELGGTPTATGKSAYSVVNKNGFQVSMNVKQFAPNELTVKTIDNCIVVEGQHEDKEDGHGVISRHFIRKYMLPKGYDPNEVLSTLSSDGILTVKAPPPPAAKTDERLERIVDIQQTGPTHLSAKETSKEQPKTAASGAALQQPQQQQQQPMEVQQQQSKQPKQPHQQQPLEVPKAAAERNGDASLNEVHAESETEKSESNSKDNEQPQQPAEGETLLASSAVVPTAIDAIMAAATADADAADADAADEDNEDANANTRESENNIENNGTSSADADAIVGSIPVAVPVADVAAAVAGDGENSSSTTAVTIATISDGVIDGVIVTEEQADVMDVDGVAVVAAPVSVENLVVVAAAQPTAGDLVVAADAAILLAKTQCENGEKTAGAAVAAAAAAEEMAN